MRTAGAVTAPAHVRTLAMTRAPFASFTAGSRTIPAAARTPSRATATPARVVRATTSAARPGCAPTTARMPTGSVTPRRVSRSRSRLRAAASRDSTVPVGQPRSRAASDPLSPSR